MQNLAQLWRHLGREAGAAGVALAAALLLRLGLAGIGWPAVNSDEATLGLMADDILWHGAHPVFFYGQAYMGALQAYLAAALFALVGPTDAVLHAATTLEFCLFLAALYAFTRAVYSWPVAWGAIALLALGPGQALFLELRAGAGTQDTLLFGALLFWLAYLRLRRPTRASGCTVLDAGIGVVAGLGLWGDVLILPLVLAAGLALTADALRRLRANPGLTQARPAHDLAVQLAAVGLSFVLGCAPFIGANVASHGATFAQVLSVAATGNRAAAPATSPFGHIIALVGQVVATVLVGLPHALGSSTICSGCSVWPIPPSKGSVADVLREVVISLPFSIAAIAVWTVAALPLARDVWRSRTATRRGSSMLLSPRDPATPEAYDARWWGRAMLVVGAALTLLVYVASSASYTFANIERYLVGIYVCAPLLADPLFRGASQVWRWVAVRGRGECEARHPPWAAFLAVSLLVAIVGLDLGGIRDALVQASDARSHSVAAGTRDAEVIAFLRAHGSASFYTTYWVCDRMMFEAVEGVRCAVVRDDDPFVPGLNRLAGAWSTVRASAHPGYVFDAEGQGGLPAAALQVLARVCASDTRFIGYAYTTIGGYDVYYYAGHLTPAASPLPCG